MAVETVTPAVEGHTGLPREAILPPWRREPYRLWSLLEIMKKVDPQFLHQVINFCLVEGSYSGIKHTLQKLKLTDAKVSDGKPLFTLPEAQEIADLFVAHGLPRSADILIEWIGQDVRSRRLPPEVVMSELQRSIERELRANLFLHVEEKYRKYFEHGHHFGEKVDSAFPSASRDIEEAGKCYALSRWTACVFHLMRVLEVGLRCLAASLNDPRLNPKHNPSWDSILKKCREELAKDRRNRSPEWAEDDTFFSVATASLMAVKDAWRNPTMHVETSYNEENALDVWNASRGFMSHLATKLSE